MRESLEDPSAKSTYRNIVENLQTSNKTSGVATHGVTRQTIGSQLKTVNSPDCSTIERIR